MTPDELTQIIKDELDNSVPDTYAHVVVSHQTRGAYKYGTLNSYSIPQTKNLKAFEATKLDEYQRKEYESFHEAKKLSEKQNQLKLNMDKDLDVALQYQIEEACKRSEEMEKQRQQGIRKNKDKEDLTSFQNF